MAGAALHTCLWSPPVPLAPQPPRAGPRHRKASDGSCPAAQVRLRLSSPLPLVAYHVPCRPLVRSDGEIFEFDIEIAKQSVTINTMLEDLGMDDEGDDEPVPLPNVNAAIFKKVIQWCTHHKDDPPPPEDDENKEKQTDNIPVWDQEFLKVDQGTLFELILAANYLLDVPVNNADFVIKGNTIISRETSKCFIQSNVQVVIKGLLDVTCKTVFKTETLKRFVKPSISKTTTEVEEAQVFKENQWCEEK
ncbi:hypothetical protein QTO34_006086 [Cnephaeus nilssonii]|uniref:S-phase kinase-associated protein 1 n=1 Tax=Cnephaeus nilssonii TaxID=3371016 RepID=A0AA40HLZ4_CNENI|nr:hypothetical protein QTO34_006086 [Eptesicus nilssonii]